MTIRSSFSPKATTTLSTIVVSMAEGKSGCCQNTWLVECEDICLISVRKHDC